MNLPGITMDRSAARAAFLDYKRAVQRRHSDEDEALMRGYAALSRGHQVISLVDAIVAGGLDDMGRPKLAVARSDQTRVRLTRSGNGFAFDRFESSRTNSAFRRVVPWPVRQDTHRWWDALSVVPIVPPALRPKGGLWNYWTLFEADWKRVPGDPALLRSIGNGLYVVLATWDLTPLEAAVLGMTRRT